MTTAFLSKIAKFWQKIL